jgi:hypothetical protein
MPLEDVTRRLLLTAARESIRHEFEGNGTTPSPALDPALEEVRATFVTLKRAGSLRGCIGVLEALRPLLLDVRHNAWAAAFRDPRFKPVQAHEVPELAIEISVLSPPLPLAAASRESLLQALVPGEDGLILQEGQHRATFLPAVWETLPQPADFLDQLLHKAGLKPGHWSRNLRFFRYNTESFGEHTP